MLAQEQDREEGTSMAGVCYKESKVGKHFI